MAAKGRVVLRALRAFVVQNLLAKSSGHTRNSDLGHKLPKGRDDFVFAACEHLSAPMTGPLDIKPIAFPSRGCREAVGHFVGNELVAGAVADQCRAGHARNLPLALKAMADEPP